MRSTLAGHALQRSSPRSLHGRELTRTELQIEGLHLHHRIPAGVASPFVATSVATVDQGAQIPSGAQQGALLLLRWRLMQRRIFRAPPPWPCYPVSPITL